MKKLVIGTLAAGALLAATPAMAQVWVDGPGVGVRIGSDHPGYRHYGWDNGHHYGWRNRGCRTVTVRERMPNGNVVVRTRERC
jgi:hypothetical protein